MDQIVQYLGSKYYQGIDNPMMHLAVRKEIRKRNSILLSIKSTGKRKAEMFRDQIEHVFMLREFIHLFEHQNRNNFRDIWEFHVSDSEELPVPTGGIKSSTIKNLHHNATIRIQLCQRFIVIFSLINIFSSSHASTSSPLHTDTHLLLFICIHIFSSSQK